MNQKYNIIGQRFGRLTVISLSPIKKSRKLYWNCKCDCGNTTVVSGSNLRAGKVISCGCAHKYAKLDDLTNQQFGYLTVKELDKNNNFARIHWICECICGNKISVAAIHLKNNKITHCGCQSNISQGENKIKEILLKDNISFEQHKYIKYKNHRYFFDFYIENKYFVEYDGQQHFRCSYSGWNTEENFIATKQRDNLKNQYCFENNIPLIRIPYTIFDTLSLEDIQLNTTKYLVLKESK